MEDGIPSKEEEYDGIPMGARIPEQWGGKKEKLMQFERRKARPTTKQKIAFSHILIWKIYHDTLAGSDV